MELQCEVCMLPGVRGLWMTVPAPNTANVGDILTVVVEAEPAACAYKKACEIMISRGDTQVCKHAMRAITDKAEGRRRLEYNLACERFFREVETTQEERALLARFIENVNQGVM